MLTGAVKNTVDGIWSDFWTGGVTNPITVIEQFTYLLFIKRLDDIQLVKEKKANRLDEEIEDPIFNKRQKSFRWSNFKNKGPEEMFELVSSKVFPFIKNLHGTEESSYAKHMKDALFQIPNAALLSKVVEKIDELPLKNRDSKGDLYEYLLSKLTTAGLNGQFRTPRHIIKMMTDLVKPKPDDTICDPSCGTAGFLVAASEYIREHHEDEFHSRKFKKHFSKKMFTGFDFDSSMLRISSMNLMSHGIENPTIEYCDALSEVDSHTDPSFLDPNKFSLILANPPFKGSLDHDACASDLQKVVKTKKTELLFLALILRTLKLGGRCAVIVPDGVLFGSSKAHLAIRKTIVEDHKLEAVIDMPSGVFKPYAGVSTAVLIFTKTDCGGTDNVWFYNMNADGYSLDDKRTQLDLEKHEFNNIPDIIARYNKLNLEKKRTRSDQSFFVPKKEIVGNKYDLSINRYKEVEYDEVKYDDPKEIIQHLVSLEKKISSTLQCLMEDSN